MTPDLAQLLQDPGRAAEVPPDEIPPLLGELERLKATLWARMMSTVGPNNSQPEAVADGDRLLILPEVAELIGVPKGYAYELARRGEIPTVRFGKYVRVRETDLREWVARHQEKALDKPINVTINSTRDRRGGTQNPAAARAHSGRVRQTGRRSPRDREPVGTGETRHSGVSGPAHPAPRKDGAEEKA